MTAFRKGWRPVSAIILLFLLWEAASLLFEVPSWLLPSPSQIWQEGIAGWPDYRYHLWSTIRLTIVGFSIGTIIGIAVAICLHLLPKLRDTLYPLMILSQNVPIIVLAPLLVIWFGFGVLPKLIVITLVCFFPIAVAAMDGFKQTDADLMHYMKMAGATKGQIFRKLEWPFALPALFSGLKISATYSVMGAVISEWLGAKQGIGVYMTLASSSFRTDRVFVAIFLIMALCLIFFAFIILLERWTVRWKTKGAKNNG
ncbi:ABC transporter permease [Sediminibacillus albus]|uniref:ABC-type nitrate/sulfonate/bicarbonate transport system, permease component n=1 Tax=Sediminibacillus albus TaxID=407036 RepID=A0A1G9AQG4_9BACI|nr:ABC transporter permease [Sediminibacillus albus]SDK29582.1 ABC-type nitrate/sulfonate/bicarbonate transport system, permease component [Sediminibacillus albus]